VIAFGGEPDRIAALVNRSVQAGVLSFPHAARAEKEGMKILLKTGDYIPRLGGSFLTHRDNLKEKRDMVKRFVRAMAKADEYVKANRKGTIDVIQKYFEINDAAVNDGIYNQVATAYSPDLPADLVKALFESRATPELGWAKGKPLPELEQYVARDLLNEVMKELGIKPSK
jgi:ABC-type nitrate/sulfonate/bicarbonate transport system substrate-binding protein